MALVNMHSSRESEGLLEVADKVTETKQQPDYSSVYKVLKTVSMLLIYVCKVRKT